MEAVEGQLIDRATAGDKDALSALLQQYGPELRSRFQGQIPSRWQSVLSLDDLIQETYTDAFMDIADYVDQGNGSMGRWLSSIARHNLLNAIEMLEAEKRGGKARRVDLGNSDESYVALYEWLGGTTTSPSKCAASVEAKAVLQQAVKKLPPDYQQVVEMYDLSGASADNVASALGRSAGAVFMLRARAHKALRRLLGTPSKFLST